MTGIDRWTFHSTEVMLVARTSAPSLLRLLRPHRTPALGAGAMSEAGSRAGADGLAPGDVVQSLDQRLEKTSLQKDGVDEFFSVPGADADETRAEDDPVTDLLTRKETELMALRSRRVFDLESRVERRCAEIAELRARLSSLREDFAYNLNLLDERDGELEKYDAQFARCATEAEQGAKQLREQRLVTQEAVSEQRRWQTRCAESESNYARRVAEHRDVVEQERFARNEALLRQREEFDNHTRALMRQIAERDELLEVTRADAKDAVANETRRAREGADVENADADANESARKAEKEALLRRVEVARQRMGEAETEAETSRVAKKEAEAQLSEAKRLAGEARRQSDAQIAQLREKLETAARRGARLAEDADAAAAAAAAAIRLAEAAAEDARQEALGAGLRRDAEHAAECSLLAARGDALLQRADAAERALEETRASALATRRELEERFAEASSVDRVRDSSRAEDARLGADRAVVERDEAVSARREAERNVAASSARETALRDDLARLKAESDSVKLALAAAHERAHAASRNTAEIRAEAEHFASVTSKTAKAEGDTRCAAFANRCAGLEAKLASVESHVDKVLAERDEALLEMETQRRSFAERDVLRRHAVRLHESVRRNVPDLERTDRPPAPEPSSSETNMQNLQHENRKLRESISLMRHEMERGVASNASTPGSTPRPRLLRPKIFSTPPASLQASPLPRERGYDQTSSSGAVSHVTVELELQRAENKRLTRDKEKLLDMSNRLRAELDVVSSRLAESAMDLFSENPLLQAASRAAKNKTASISSFALLGQTPPQTQTRVKFDYVRGPNVKASDKVLPSQRNALRKTNVSQTEVRRVRNWNDKGDGGGVTAKDTTVIHQR